MDNKQLILYILFILAMYILFTLTIYILFQISFKIIIQGGNKMEEVKNLPIYYDSEFTRLHRNGQLISVAFVSETGNIFYAEFNDYMELYPEPLDVWIQENVIANLIFNNLESISISNSDQMTKNTHVFMKGNREEVRKELLTWIHIEVTSNGYDKAQIYSDCYAYDWMLFNDLICEDGLALNLPDFINYIPIDLCSYLQVNGIDPDTNREDLVKFYGNTIDDINKSFSTFVPGRKISKHSSIFDALVIKTIFEAINNMNE